MPTKTSTLSNTSIEILYENEELIILNKPAGLLVIPDRFDLSLPCLKQLMEQRLRRPLWVVHRLDRETSGVICMAKNEAAHRYLSGLFREHEVGKFYTGLVNGQVIPTSGRIETPLAPHPTVRGKMITAKKGKPSITEYEVVQQWPLYSLVKFRIHTGRTHQIRVHMQSVGHSLVCDPLYGDGKPLFLSSIKKKYRASGNEEEERPLLSRVALHASRLQFTLENGEPLDVEAPLPKDLSACIRQLNKWSPPSAAFLYGN